MHDLLLLLGAHLRESFRQPPAGAAQNGRGHLQIALQADRLAASSRRNLPLGFEKQLRLGEDALAGHSRSITPGGIQLPGFSCIAVMLDEGGRHPLAVFQAYTRYRHQELHGHMRADFAFAHLLLNGFRQKFHQRQPPRNPAHAPVETARQLLQPVGEALLQFRQQPALFQRGLVFGQPQ